MQQQRKKQPKTTFSAWNSIQTPAHKHTKRDIYIDRECYQPPVRPFSSEWIRIWIEIAKYAVTNDMPRSRIQTKNATITSIQRLSKANLLCVSPCLEIETIGSKLNIGFGFCYIFGLGFGFGLRFSFFSLAFGNSKK